MNWLKNKLVPFSATTACWWLLVALLVLGQLTRFEVVAGIGFFPHDVLLGVLASIKLSSLFKRRVLTKPDTQLLVFLGFLLLSILRGIFLGSFTLVSMAFVLRLTVYLLGLWQLVGLVSKNQRLTGLSVASLLILIFGYAQLLVIPDTRWLRWLGWDDHYYRLISTYLDPAFTSLVLLFGFHLSFQIKTKLKWISYILSSLFVLGIVLTASRSTYLALLAYSFIHFSSRKWHFALGVLITSLTIGAASFIPFGEGWNLLRTSTVQARITNAQEWTASMSMTDWVIGKGLFWQLDREVLTKLATHSRVPDSSLLFILTGVGLIGTSTLVLYARNNVSNLSKSGWAVLVAWLIHSQFSASLTQPFIIIWIFLLLSLEFKRDGD